MLFLVHPWLILFQTGESKRNMFSPSQVVDAVKCSFKKRPNHRRMYLLLLIVIFVTEVGPFQGEANIRYLYVRTRYGWEVEEFSNYNTFNAGLTLIGKLYLLNFWLGQQLTIVLLTFLSPINFHSNLDCPANKRDPDFVCGCDDGHWKAHCARLCHRRMDVLLR